MISKQEKLNLSTYLALYDLMIPQDNMLRQINELVDSSFILDELKMMCYLDNGVQKRGRDKTISFVIGANLVKFY